MFFLQLLESMSVTVSSPGIVRVDNIGAKFMAENVTTTSRSTFDTSMSTNMLKTERWRLFLFAQRRHHDEESRRWVVRQTCKGACDDGPEFVKNQSQQEGCQNGRFFGFVDWLSSMCFVQKWMFSICLGDWLSKSVRIGSGTSKKLEGICADVGSRFRRMYWSIRDLYERLRCSVLFYWLMN